MLSSRMRDEEENGGTPGDLLKVHFWLGFMLLVMASIILEFFKNLCLFACIQCSVSASRSKLYVLPVTCCLCKG